MFRRILASAPRVSTRFYSVQPSATPRPGGFWNYVRSDTFRSLVLLNIIASELFYLITSQAEYEKSTSKKTAQIDTYRDIITRMINGETVDLEAELKGLNEHEDRSYDSIMKELEDLDRNFSGAGESGEVVFQPKKQESKSIGKHL